MIRKSKPAVKAKPRRKQPESIEELAREQGVKAIQDPHELRGDFWPKEEDLEDFLSWLRKARREGR